MVRQWILTIVRYDFIHDIYNDFKSCVATICMDLHTRARAQITNTKNATIVNTHNTQKRHNNTHTHTPTQKCHNTIHAYTHAYTNTAVQMLLLWLLIKQTKQKKRKKHRGEKAREN